MSCPGCAGREAVAIRQWIVSASHRVTARACRTCGVLWCAPLPPAGEAAAYYAPEGAWALRQPAPAIQIEPSRPVALDAVAGVWPDVLGPSSDAVVLDYGCGTGGTLDAFRSLGWLTVGCEPSTVTAFTRHARITTIPETTSFDVVWLYHVLEHLREPGRTLCRLGAALRPGGRLFVSVPRLDTLAAHRQPKYCLRWPVHLVAFTEASLRWLLAAAGLRVVATFHDHVSSHKHGLPRRLQVLAQRDGAAEYPADPFAALAPVLDAYAALRVAA